MRSKSSPTHFLYVATASVIVALAPTGCTSSSTEAASGTSNNTSASNSSSDGVTSSSTQGSGGSTGTGGNGGSQGEGGAGGSTTTSADVVRFIAMGDGGEGNGTQLQVAQAIKAECDLRGGCEFALYLGDNIYNSGADNVMDSQFQTKFETPYSNLNFMFYITLGNHDYGGGGAGYQFYKGDVQVDYTNYSTKWYLPSRYYKQSVVAGSTTVDLFSLDTNQIMYTGDSAQKAWLQAELAASTATWKLAFGHHTYVSNGKHGNAGDYEDLPIALPIVSGQNVKSFIDDAVCNAADVYFCGHDHNRQWLQPTCGTEFIVSGTAAKSTDLHDSEAPTFFETDINGGFMLVEIAGNSMTGWFYDENGVEEFSRTVSK